VFQINYNDETYTWINFGMFTTLEFYLGIITACLPFLPPVGSRIMTSFRDSKFSGVLSWTGASARRLWSTDASKTDPLKHKSSDVSGASNSRPDQYDDSYYYPLNSRSPARQKLAAPPVTRVSFSDSIV
jgi:hypothetical protein